MELFTIALLVWFAGLGIGYLAIALCKAASRPVPRYDVGISYREEDVHICDWRYCSTCTHNNLCHSLEWEE